MVGVRLCRLWLVFDRVLVGVVVGVGLYFGEGKGCRWVVFWLG